MRTRENLGGLVNASSKTTPQRATKAQIGKVFGVVLNENTPSKELFDKVGGWNGIGSVFYLDYDQSKNINETDLNKCKIAKPFDASNQNYPLIGELVTLVNGPAPSSQLSNSAVQKYYTGIVNVWNNNQQNVLSGDNLGNTFVENNDIRNLLTFEGDRIYQGRKGNGLRFSSTVPRYANISEWSRGGRPDGDPIIILVNGYVTSDKTGTAPNIEEINKEKSSIYMTSTQLIPLQPGALIKNTVNSSVAPKNYFDSQIILNSDRIVINSKKDEVLLYSKTNMELSSDQIINLNVGNYLHIHTDPKNKDSKILLGTKNDGTVPTEPVLLGNQTQDFLLELLKALSRLAGYLSTATAVASDGAIPIESCNEGGTQLFNDVDSLIGKLEKIISNKVYTV